MHKYLQKLDEALGRKRAVARLSEVFGDDAQTAIVKKDPFSLREYLKKSSEGAPTDVPDGVGTVVGAGAGFLIGLKVGRPIVATIGGASLGRNLPALFDRDLRSIAGRNLAVTGTAIVGSVLIGGSALRRAVGYGIGHLIASMATYFGGWGEK